MYLFNLENLATILLEMRQLNSLFQCKCLSYVLDYTNTQSQHVLCGICRCGK